MTAYNPGQQIVLERNPDFRFVAGPMSTSSPCNSAWSR